MTSIVHLDWNKDHETHYSRFTSRNTHFVAPETQQQIRALKVLIAGCGSTGGACIESLARLGVEHFVLADNGQYELANLNRQHARAQDLGKNKAEFHREEVLAINPFAHVEIDRNGITTKNARKFCEDVDIIFDAVDVTTPEGIAAKLELHREAHHAHKPVLSALDVGWRQWGRSFDYRDGRLPVLDGRLRAAEETKHPIRALFAIYPFNAIPPHALSMVEDLLLGRSDFASQLGCTSDALSAIIVPVIVRFVETGELTRGWSLDLDQFRQSRWRSIVQEIKAVPRRLKIKRLLQRTP